MTHPYPMTTLMPICHCPIMTALAIWAPLDNEIPALGSPVSCRLRSVSVKS